MIQEHEHGKPDTAARVQPDARTADAHVSARDADGARQVQALRERVDALEQANRQLIKRCWTAEQSAAMVDGTLALRLVKAKASFQENLKRRIRKADYLYFALKTANWVLRFGPGKLKLFMRGFRAERARVKAVIRRPSEREKARQRGEKFAPPMKISLLAPLCGASPERLAAMIQSVRAQTCSDWELCLAGGADSAEIRRACRACADGDPRIRYAEADESRGVGHLLNACAEMATGDYLALLSPEDALHPSALYAVMQAIGEDNADFVYTDEDAFDETPEDAGAPRYKPDFAPDTLRSQNYIGRLAVFSRDLLEAAGGLCADAPDGDWEYDLVLRLTEQAKAVAHVPSALYHRRRHADESPKSAVGALDRHLSRVGLKGSVEAGRVPSTYRIRYEIEGDDLVSIIIPNKDHVDNLNTCIASIRSRTTYRRWEIIVVENNSTQPETFEYYRSLEADERIRVVRFEGAFNYSAVNNFGAKYAAGKYLLLLNNDTEVVTPDWIEQMLMYAQRSDVGAVGAMLYYPDDTVQHAGLVIGIGGIAGHVFRHLPRNDAGYMNRAAIVQDLSAVTAACVLIPARVWQAVDGLNEAFAVAFNDVDLCMRIRQAGYRIVFTPWAELYHYEYNSRGYENTAAKRARYNREILLFRQTWERELNQGDPCYNPNLTIVREDFSTIYE